MSFKEELKKARLSAFLTQKGLAEQTGLSLGSIKNWERGNYLPSTTAWESLCDFFMYRTSFKELNKEYLLEKTQRGKTYGK